MKKNCGVRGARSRSTTVSLSQVFPHVCARPSGKLRPFISLALPLNARSRGKCVVCLHPRQSERVSFFLRILENTLPSLVAVTLTLLVTCFTLPLAIKIHVHDIHLVNFPVYFSTMFRRFDRVCSTSISILFRPDCGVFRCYPWKFERTFYIV